jgi:integrase
VGEARRAGMIGQEEAPSVTDIPDIRQEGTRLRNWLTREQAKELLAVPDRSSLKGKRDYVILALLVGCALRRELAELDVETIQQREGRWVPTEVFTKVTDPGSPWRRRRLSNDVIAAPLDVQLLSHYSESRAMHLLRWPAGKSERSARRTTCLQPSSEFAEVASWCLEIFEHRWNKP